MAKLFANSGDLDQILHSDLSLHCLPSTLLRVSRLQWVKVSNTYSNMKLINGKLEVQIAGTVL